MFPLRDENPTELTPFVTVAIIAANVAVWIYLQGAGYSAEVVMASVCEFGMIPADLTGEPAPPHVPRVCPEDAGFGWATVVTSMFLHGSWVHLLGNMWFLWIFGNNIEDSTGHLRFLLFYLLAGAAAGGAHVVSAASSPVPTVGASGAISAVMGAYLLLYPRVRVYMLVLFFIFRIPAWMFLIYYFAIQVMLGLQVEPVTGGVAFWAHAGGFAAGLLLVKAFENPELVGAKRRGVKLDPRQVRHRGWW